MLAWLLLGETLARDEFDDRLSALDRLGDRGQSLHELRDQFSASTISGANPQHARPPPACHANEGKVAILRDKNGWTRDGLLPDPLICRREKVEIANMKGVISDRTQYDGE